jgi:hypothetical protein
MRNGEKLAAYHRRHAKKAEKLAAGSGIGVKIYQLMAALLAAVNVNQRQKLNEGENVGISRNQ